MSARILPAAPPRLRDLQAVLENSRKPLVERYVAAVTLARTGSATAGDILATALANADPETAVGILLGLARAGDRPALARVLRATKSRDARVASTARFAAMLISHRLGLNPRALQAPAGRLVSLDRASGRPLMIRPAAPEEAQLWLESLAHDSFGIELAAEPAYKIYCRAQRMMIMMNRDLVGTDAAARLERRSALLGVVASRSRHDRSHYLSLLILARPTSRPRTVAIEVFTTRGKTAFRGTGVVRSGEIRFAVRSRAHAGVVAALLEGILDEDGLQFTTAVVEPFLPEKRRPSAVRGQTPLM